MARKTYKGADLFRQADPEWHGDHLGLPRPDGKVLTLGADGCEATAFTVGGNLLNGTALTPREVNAHLSAVSKLYFDSGRHHGRQCFVSLGHDDQGRIVTHPGPLIVLEESAKEYGLHCPDAGRLRSKPGDVALSQLLCETLDAGKLAIIHVDHNAVDGGDHFCLALERQGGAILVFDPAMGNTMTIDDIGLEGRTKWGSVDKTFRVVSVAPFWK